MPRARCKLEARLLEFMNERGFGASRFAVGYSGGPDSSALLAAAASLFPGKPIAVFVDHGIRGSEERERELGIVRATCVSLGVRLLVARVRPGAVLELAKKTGEGTEAAARRYRYAAFRTAAKKTGVAAMLLAHTNDDQLETVLMRLIGGSGAGGIKGIPVSSGMFLRPFLGFAKSDLQAYIAVKGIECSIDSSNASGDYLRNRIRHGLVPFLDRDFPGWRRGLSRTAEIAALDEAALAEISETVDFAPFSGAAGELQSSSETLFAVPRAVAIRAIVRAAASVLGMRRFSSRLAEAALAAIERNESAIYRGGGLELRRSGNLVLLHRGLDFPRRGGYFVLVDRPRRVRVGSLVVRASWSEDGSSGIRADAFSFPLVVRSRRPGDAIALKDGSKRLDALFSEWDLREDARRTTPVVEDRDGIVAVLGAGFGGKDRYRAFAVGEGSSEGVRRLLVSVKGA